MGKIGMSLHWTAGIYTPNHIELADYHGGVTWRNQKAQFEKWNDYSENLPHTWQRNSDLIGLTVCGMAEATSRDWGKYPIQPEQIKELCLAAAEIAFLKKIQTQNIKTHAEWAIVDGYFGERWDLARVNPGKIDIKIAIETGDELRRRIKMFKERMIKSLIYPRAFHFENKRKGVII